MIKIKKAAIFGLDARIALAIFGALSVISGAALYSAIQNAKATQVISQINEIEKAFEQYWLDTGSQVYGTRYRGATGANYAWHIDLYWLKNNPGLAGWNGPYISMNYLEGNSSFPQTAYESNGISYVLAKIKPDEVWGDVISPTQCTSTSCNVFLQVGPFKKSLVTLIDDKIDNGDGAQAGRVRIGSLGTGIFYNTGIHYDIDKYDIEN